MQAVARYEFRWQTHGQKMRLALSCIRWYPLHGCEMAHASHTFWWGMLKKETRVNLLKVTSTFVLHVFAFFDVESAWKWYTSVIPALYHSISIKGSTTETHSLSMLQPSSSKRGAHQPHLEPGSKHIRTRLKNVKGCKRMGLNRIITPSITIPIPKVYQKVFFCTASSAKKKSETIQSHVRYKDSSKIQLSSSQSTMIWNNWFQ